MYEIFVKLLEKYGITAYKVGKATGIGASTFSDWKNGRSTPKQEKLQKIADYFGVTVDYLMTGNDEKEKKELKTISNNKICIENFEPTYAEMQQLIARNGSKLTTEEKMLLIKLLSEL